MDNDSLKETMEVKLEALKDILNMGMANLHKELVEIKNEFQAHVCANEGDSKEHRESIKRVYDRIEKVEGRIAKLEDRTWWNKVFDSFTSSLGPLLLGAVLWFIASGGITAFLKSMGH